MFVLDTNVLSEIMKSKPDPRVAGWVARQPRELVFTTVVCKAEILAGVAMMPVGRRRRDLEEVARNLFETGFRGRVLPFEDAATPVFAQILDSTTAGGTHDQRGGFHYCRHHPNPRCDRRDPQRRRLRADRRPNHQSLGPNLT